MNEAYLTLLAPAGEELRDHLEFLIEEAASNEYFGLFGAHIYICDTCGTVFAFRTRALMESFKVVHEHYERQRIFDRLTLAVIDKEMLCNMTSF
jgi:hypothetical protein